MSKYKRKRKVNKTILIGVIIVLILFIISTGYSLWSDTLYINGTVNLKYSEPKLENITVNKSEDHYVASEEDYFIKALTVENSEVINDTTMQINATISIKSYTMTSRDAVITATFVNNYDTTITDGAVEIMENTTGMTVTNSTTQTVASGENATIQSNFRITSSTKTSVLKLRISYEVDEVTRYLYLNINFTK